MTPASSPAEPRPGHRPATWTKRLVFGLVVLGVAAGPVCFLFRDDNREHFSRVLFDSAAWKNADLEDYKNPIRLRLVDDLLQRHKLVGRSRAEVDDLLGVPPKTDYFRAYDHVYWLGPERGFISIDSEWLVIKFEQDRVVEVRVVQD